MSRPKKVGKRKSVHNCPWKGTEPRILYTMGAQGCSKQKSLKARGEIQECQLYSWYFV